VFPYLAVLALIAFVADASVRLWGRGGRRRAAVVGGAVVFFLLVAGGHSALVETGIVQMPYLISWAYLCVLLAMGHELSADIFAAVQTSRQLQDSERRMDLASDAAGLGMWTWDIIRDQIWATSRARSLFGFSKSENLSLPRFMSAVHPDDRDAVRQAIDSSLNADRDYELEFRVLLPDGRTRWIAARGRADRDAAGKPVLMRGVVLDISARRRSELELQQVQGQLAHVGRVSMLGELAAALAHELGQPLGAILRNAEAAELFLQHEPPDLDELRAILADIRRDDQRAGDVIERLRSLLKRRSIDARPLAVSDLLSGCAALTHAEATARRVKLEFEAEPALPNVMGDRVHLQQVLLNLVLNAMDAVEGEPAERRLVSVRARLDGGRTVEVAVSDSGHGMTPERLALVFEPFFTTKSNGMGIGLPISRTIIEAHGGHIWAESNADKGATFRFTLPVSEEPVADAAPAS
jgi:PAS domain S-box-containing protein